MKITKQFCGIPIKRYLVAMVRLGLYEGYIGDISG